MMTALDLTGDIIDVREIIERFEELETELVSIYNELQTEDNEATSSEDDGFVVWVSSLETEEAQEFRELQDILEELKGYGGDEDWRGDWYPITLISEDYWVNYCEELVSDIGDLPRDIPSYISIDWEKTADNIKQDYSYISIGKTDYWYR